MTRTRCYTLVLDDGTVARIHCQRRPSIQDVRALTAVAEALRKQKQRARTKAPDSAGAAGGHNER